MSKIIKRLYVGLIFIFLYAPILILILYSFNDSKSRGNWGGFTLRWYRELFSDRTIISSLQYTLIIAVLSAVIATVIGTLAAVAINGMNKWTRSVVMNITYLPVLNPDIVTGVSLMLLFIFIKLPLGFVSLLLAHISFNVPYVILSVLPKLKQMRGAQYEAALDLGASPYQAFHKVVLPEIMPGIINGLLMAFTLSIDDFVISFFTTGGGVSTLSITIYSMARRGIKPSLNALSALMFVVVLALLLIINMRTKNNNQNTNKLAKESALK